MGASESEIISRIEREARQDALDERNAALKQVGDHQVPPVADDEESKAPSDGGLLRLIQEEVKSEVARATEAFIPAREVVETMDACLAISTGLEGRLVALESEVGNAQRVVGKSANRFDALSEAFEALQEVVRTLEKLVDGIAEDLPRRGSTSRFTEGPRGPH